MSQPHFSDVPVQEFVELLEGGLGRIPSILGMIVNVLLKPRLHVRDLGLHRRLEAIEHRNQGISDRDDLTVLINDDGMGKGINLLFEDVETVSEAVHDDYHVGVRCFQFLHAIVERNQGLDDLLVLAHTCLPFAYFGFHRLRGL
jgi:hypothetical protein